MAFTSIASLYSHPQPQVRLRNQRLQSLAVTAAQFVWLPMLNSRRSRALIVRSASSVEGTPSPAVASLTVYRESQANAPLSVAPVKQIAPAAASFGFFFALTFVIWKLWETLLNDLSQEPRSFDQSAYEYYLENEGSYLLNDNFGITEEHGFYY